MDFEPNLFISYAHIDNEPLSPGEPGWVSRFHDTLEVLLNMRLGKKANIWRDKRLQGNDAFGDEIVTQFSKATVLISIVTSGYLTSDWCTREVREFCENVQRRGGLRVDNKTRVFKVIKAPVEHRALLPEALGYEFFIIKDGAPLELDPAYGPEYAQTYNRKVAVLAWEIASLLKTMEARSRQPYDVGRNGGTAPQAPQKPSIYLAECSRDRRPARDLLEAELTRLGYPVLPDKPLPTYELEHVAAVEAFLARCALSIHLVGENYGTVPDGPTSKSVVMHQNELAVARCRNSKLLRLIWLPKGTRSEQPLQQAFIDALNQDAEAQLGADLLMGDIEELKAAIHATLKKIEQPPLPVRVATEESAGGDKARLLYLVCDEKDRKATVPLRKFCRQLGFDVEVPAFEGDAAQVRKTNQQFLVDCDGVMLFYGAGDEAWKRTIDSELKKMAGYRDKPLLAKRIYLAEPRTRDKEDLIDMAEPGLIDGLAGLPEAAMSDFLRAATGGWCAVTGAAAGPRVNPFPGLRPFKEDEAHLFFGRENQVDAMVDKLGETHFLAVIGTLGSGKSSLVNCGLRPALHQGLMARAGTAWRMAQFRPGNDPIGAMARALAQDGVLFAAREAATLTMSEVVETTLRMSRLGLVDICEQAALGEGVNLLLVVDQFEELFRYRQLGSAGSLAEDAAALVNLLLEVKAHPESRIFVVLTMRSDFLGDCTQFPGLAEAINAGQYLVPRMTRDERRDAIVRPVGVGGAEMAPVLLTRLVNDVGDNPDQLSILQHALNRTWALWEDAGSKGPLDLAHYEAIGTMEHVLDRHVDEAHAELDDR